MPRDGSGAYTLPVGNPVVSGTLIESYWANSTLSDIAVQLNNVLTRDGVLGPILPLKLVDGAVATPGLAFNSEPGLGIYRSGTGTIRFAAINANTMELNASSGTNTYLGLFPRLPGSASSSKLILSNQPLSTPDRSDLVIESSPANVSFTSVPVGTNTIRPFIYSAEHHRFNLAGSGWAAFVAASPNSTRLWLDKGGVGSFTDIVGAKGGANRWGLSLGDSTLESGSNVGSNFYIARYADAGSLLSVPISIPRNNGFVSIQSRLTAIRDETGANSLVQFDAPTGGIGSLTVSTNLITGASAHGATSNQFNNVTYCFDRLEFPVGSGGYLLMQGAPNRCIAWNSYYTSGSTRVIKVFDSHQGSSGYGASIYLDLLHTPGVAASLNFVINGSTSFEMRSSGTGASSGGWISTSDRRVKDKLSQIKDALSKVLSLSGYTYDKLDMVDMDGTIPRKAGYIAQEIQAVLPEAIVVNSDSQGTLSVDHNGVIGLLIEAVKEVNARIDQIVSHP